MDWKKGIVNPKFDIDSRRKSLGRFDWTDTLLTGAEKQAVDDILLEYHDNFAKHWTDTWWITGFNIKLKPHDNKVDFS